MRIHGAATLHPLDPAHRAGGGIVVRTALLGGGLGILLGAIVLVVGVLRLRFR